MEAAEAAEAADRTETVDQEVDREDTVGTATTMDLPEITVRHQITTVHRLRVALTLDPLPTWWVVAYQEPTTAPILQEDRRRATEDHRLPRTPLDRHQICAVHRLPCHPTALILLHSHDLDTDHAKASPRRIQSKVKATICTLALSKKYSWHSHQMTITLVQAQEHSNQSA